VRAEAYELCGFQHRLGVADRMAVVLLRTFAQLDHTPHPARTTLEKWAQFFDVRGRVLAEVAKAAAAIETCSDELPRGLLGRLDEALSLIEDDSKAEVALHRHRLELLACAGRHDKVVSVCTRLIKIGLADYKTHEQLADAYLAVGKLKQGLEALRAAYASVPLEKVLSAWRLLSKVQAAERELAQQKEEEKRSRQQKREESRKGEQQRQQRQRGGRGAGGAGGAGGGAKEPACSEKPLRGAAECGESRVATQGCYDLLGVSRMLCTKGAVKKALREKGRIYHPDKYKGSKGCAEMHFKALQDAYDKLLQKCG